MNHRDHVTLIRGGFEDAGRDWLELGSGEGAFTLAAAELLGPNGRLSVLDRDSGPLVVAAERTAAMFPGVQVVPLVADFRRGLPEGPFDGVLAANSLHFVRDRAPVLAAIRRVLRPGGRLVIVEYDSDDGNQWVPFPFSFKRWQHEADRAGFTDVALVQRVPSRFLGAIYGAIALVPEGEPAP